LKMRGAKILLESLKKEGVEAIFGISGGSVLDIFDALYDEHVIKYYLTCHEQAAAHAADGYARATGKVGVCLATSGPGATNLVTGIATAHMDSIPIVAITGQVFSHLIGNDAFQEADVMGITRPITKHNFLVKNVEELAKTIKEAFYIARTGRPGPVLVDIAKDAQQKETEFVYPNEVNIRSYKPNYEGHPKQIAKAAELINNAKRPVIYAGGGVILSTAYQELFELANKARIPVTTTLMGMGGFPQTHELSLDMLGMHGTAYANKAITGCDVLIAIGARFDDRITGRIDKFAPESKIIHIDIDPTAISKNIVVDIPIVGDCKSVLEELNKLIEKPDTEEWLKQIFEWKQMFPLSYDRESNLIKPQYVVEQIYEVTKGDAIITTEVGQNQMWAAQFYKYSKPRTFISSGGLGTMGYGFPAAIGAQVGCPDRIVFDIAGDGSIQMNIQELTTAVAYKLPVKVAILNNMHLGMVRQWQDLFFNGRRSGTDLERDPDFVKIAEAFGASGILVEKPEEVRSAIEQAIETPGPVFINFMVDRDENVFPMVPAGASLDEMLGITQGMA
jgi:acetolactate synthase I/II/III large subunit